MHCILILISKSMKTLHPQTFDIPHKILKSWHGHFKWLTRQTPPYPLFGNTSIFTSIVTVTLPVTATKNIHGCENHAIRVFYWTLKHPGWNDPCKILFSLIGRSEGKSSTINLKAMRAKRQPKWKLINRRHHWHTSFFFTKRIISFNLKSCPFNG